MLIGGVINDQLSDHLDISLMGSLDKFFKLFNRTVRWIYGVVIHDVIPVVLERRRVKRKQPDSCNTNIFQVIQLAE